MAYIITPVEVSGTHRCLTESGNRRTAALLTGDARESATDEWTLLEAQGDPANDYATDRTYEGTVEFGLQCVGTIEFDIEGQIETKDNDFDWLRITLNPGTVDAEELYYHESQEPSGDPDDPADTEPITNTVTKSLTERPCGHVVLIESSTGDAKANNDIWWRVGITFP